MDETFKPRRMRRPGVARRAAVLKAAAEIFLEQGYERTSLADIVARAGGSRTLIYEQFGDKAGLFRAVMVELCETMFAPVERKGRDEREPRTILTELARQFLHSLWGDDVQALTRIVFTEGPHHPDVADIFFSYGYDAGFDQLAAYLASISAAPMSPARLRQLSMMFLSMLQGDAFDRKLAGSRHQRSRRELNEQVAMAVDWLLSQLAGAGAETRPAKRDPTPRRGETHRARSDQDGR